MKKVVLFLILLISLFIYTNYAYGVIDYEILRVHTTPNGGISMDVLVSPRATKQQVLELAYYIKGRNQDLPFLFVLIYDSKEAWANRDNENYPDEEYWKHLLVRITVNKHTGVDEVVWLARNREEPKNPLKEKPKFPPTITEEPQKTFETLSIELKENSKKIKINGEEKEIPVASFEINDSLATTVDIFPRDIFYIKYYPEHNILDLVNRMNKEAVRYYLDENIKRADTKTKRVLLPFSPYTTEDGKAIIPLRKTVELLGGKIFWQGENKPIKIIFEPPEPQTEPQAETQTEVPQEQQEEELNDVSNSYYFLFIITAIVIILVLFIFYLQKKR